MQRVFQLVLMLALLAPSICFAEPVSINRGAGMGYSFHHNGNCYIILPEHVHAKRNRLSLKPAVPGAVGDAQVFHTLDPGVDLSVAYVLAGLEGSCTERWADLPTDLKSILDRTNAAQLVRIDAAGVETRDDMVLTSATFETITARVADPAMSEIYKGTSGAILRSGETLLGIAIRSERTDEALFLRIDEIVARLGRLLASAPEPDEPPGEPPATPSSCTAGLAIKAARCSAEPLAPEYACTNLLDGSGPVIFPAGTQRPQIVLTLHSRQSLGSIQLQSSATEGVEAMPKSVLVEVSSTNGAPRWRRFGTGDMSPVGGLSVSNGARPYATEIAITLQSSWRADLPPRIDCIAIQ